MSKRLGKGLEALITSFNTEENDRYIEGTVSLDRIVPNANQPRQNFDENGMQELIDSVREKGMLQPLTSSIKEQGIIQPIIVRKSPDQSDKFEIIAGERRFRAAKEVGLEWVPVYVISVESDMEMMELALIENVQRVDLNSIEEAEGFAILSGKYGMSHDEIAHKVSKSRPEISNKLRLLKLPPVIKVSLKNGEISAGHARALVGLKKSTQMLTLFHKILNQKISVRQTEDIIKKINADPNTPKKITKVPKKDQMLTQIEGELRETLQAKVIVKKNRGGRGNIQIDFYSQDELERLIELLTSIDV